MNPSVTAPPVIRVFLSSTFADMQNERNYFNTVLQPKLSALCAERGVSFFSVDLRWGITEEEQMDGKVLPICLSEIDKCRPYFIGMIGNRYGSIVHEITENMQKTIPWLVGKEGKSITELEMLYGVLDKEIQTETQNCAFYIRDPHLSEKWFPNSEPESEALKQLKQTVSNAPEIHFVTYASLEEFGELVTADFRSWLDRVYPEAETASDARKNWYNMEFRRDFVDFPDMRRFIDNYLAADRKPLMLVGEGQRGKTAFLTNWALDRERCILLNCRSDASFNYWPSVAFEIIRKIAEIMPDASFPKPDMYASIFFAMAKRKLHTSTGKDSSKSEADSNDSSIINDIYFVTDKERDSFRIAFANWLARLTPDEPIYIVINDLEILDDAEARLLIWLPTTLPENIRIICSCGDKEIIDNAKTLGWNTKEMPLFSNALARTYFENKLMNYGKHLSDDQRNDILLSPLANYPGYLKYIVDFLNRYGLFENLSEITSSIKSISDMTSLYEYSCNIMLAEFSEEERSAFFRLLSYLRINTDALHEQDYYGLLSENASFSAILWARFSNLMEQLEVVKGEYWEINSFELLKYIDTKNQDFSAAGLALGRFYLQRLREINPLQNSYEAIRSGTENAKCAIRCLLASNNCDALAEGLTDSNVLYYLSKIDWHIVRAGWVHLMLNSELDIPSLIKEAIIRTPENKRDGIRIRTRLAQLLSDLEFRNLTFDDSDPDILKENLPGELIIFKGENASPEFLEVYNRAQHHHKERRFQQAIETVKEAFASECDMTDMEKSMLLSIKANSEISLNLTENCIKTCSQAYLCAIRSADLSLISGTLLSYGHSTYIAERNYKKAKHILNKSKRFALLNGELRTYLSACNVEAMCCYRLEEFDESERLLHLCETVWKKVGNDREVAAIRLNICNLYHIMGDNKKALRLAEETLKELEASPFENAKLIIPQVLSNIGYYQKAENETDGEEAFLASLAQLKDTDSAAYANALLNLGNLYTNKSLNSKAADQYEELAEFYFNRGEYIKAAGALNLLFSCLAQGNFNERRDSAIKEWEERFKQIPNGLAILHEELNSYSAEIIEISELREQLVIAQASNDLNAQASLLVMLALKLEPEEHAEALSCLFKAAEIYLGQNLKQDCSRVAETGIRFVLKKSETDMQALERFISFLPPEKRALAESIEELRNIAAELKYTNSTESHIKLEEIVNKLLSSDYELLAVIILSDSLETILSYCNEETVLALYNLAKKDDTCINILHNSLYSVIKEYSGEMLALKSDYMSNSAETVIHKHENLIVIFNAMNDINAACFAGNIALIFRRRKDKEKALHYHRLSSERYKAAGKNHEYLIEKLNLSTAYIEFDMLPEAVANLRETLKEARSYNERIIEASVAGNLAGLLMKSPSFALSENEIPELFEVEETVFLEEREYREYLISLINQLRYHLTLPSPDFNLIEEKLAKAKECMQKHNLREFERYIIAIENELYKIKPNPAAPGNKQKQIYDFLSQITKKKINTSDADTGRTDSMSPSELAELLVRDRKDFRIDRIKQQSDNSITAICLPVDKPEKLLTVAYISVFKGNLPDKYSARFTYAIRPTQFADNTDVSIQEYVDWWNGYSDFYRLEYHKENRTAIAVTHTAEASPDNLKTIFRKFCADCKADGTVVEFASLGINDINMFISIKKKAEQES